MKKKITPDIINLLDEFLNDINTYVSEENFKEATKLQENINRIKSEYDISDKIFEVNGRYGLKNIKEEILVPPIYKGFSEVNSYIEKRNKPVAAIGENDKYGLVTTDGEGKPLTKFEYNQIKCTHFNSVYTCYKNNGEKIEKGLIDKNGKTIVSCEMDKIHEAKGGIIILEKDSKYGLYTTWGLYIKPQYDDLTNEHDKSQTIIVRNDNMWGNLSSEGLFVPKNKSSATSLLCFYPTF